MVLGSLNMPNSGSTTTTTNDLIKQYPSPCQSSSDAQTTDEFSIGTNLDTNAGTFLSPTSSGNEPPHKDGREDKTEPMSKAGRNNTAASPESGEVSLPKRSTLYHHRCDFGTDAEVSKGTNSRKD